MFSYIQAHQAEFWAFLAIVFFVIEVTVFSLGSGLFLFAGVGAMATALLMWLGMPDTWLYGVASFGIATGGSALAMWPWLRKLQGKNRVPAKDRSSDLIGLQFRLAGPVTSTKPGQHRYSGVDWRVEIADECEVNQLEAGTLVEVRDVDVGILRVTGVKP